MKNNEKFKEQVESVMKEPMAIEPTDYEEKIRRNLIVSSSITLVMIKLGLMPTADSRFLGGMKFDNLTPDTIYTILIVIVAYELLHYSWLLVNKFSYWRVRLTGTKHIEFRGNRGSVGSSFEALDFTGKSENSNLYVWMLENNSATNSVVEQLNKHWLEVEGLCQGLKSDSSDQSKLDGLLKKLNEIDSSSKSLERHLTNIRISASLHRFDNWYHFLVRSQSVRWLLLDVLLPVSIGIYSLYCLSDALL
ncbi:TPA: hypothetical protein PMB29_003499 [Vibrio cholerae]|nr:hypothetical protein [Vibrio cholerae]